MFWLYLIVWALLVPVNIVVTVAVFFLAPVAVLLFSSADKRSLTRWHWIETIDNDLTGDDGWRSEHLWGSDPLSTINRIRWLWRNGGNRFNYTRIGCRAQDEIRTIDLGPLVMLRQPSGHWMYRRYFKLTEKRMLEVYLGWALLGPKQGRCKYVCTIRPKTKP